MKNKFLLPVLALSIIGLSALPSNAATDSDTATFTATLAAFINVTGSNGTGTISDTGVLTPTTNASYQVVTNSQGGSSGIFSSVYTGATNNLSQQGGVNYIALANGAGLGTAVDNALGGAPVTTSNANVIAYAVTVTPSGGGSPFTWSSPNLVGQIGTTPATRFVDVNITGAARPGTFSELDADGSYTATMTLEATTTP